MSFFKNKPDPLEQKLTLTEAIGEYDRSFRDRAERALEEFFSTKEDCIYMLGPTSYLISLCGTKIAVDPQVRRKEDFDALSALLLSYLPRLDAVLISHEHDDHFSTPLARLLKNEDLLWYLPKGMNRRWVEESELSEKSIRFVSEGDTVTIGALTVEVYDTPHIPFGRPIALIERAYFICSAKGSIFLPGDVREYGYIGYKGMKKPDLCIGHVWAGDDSDHPEAYLPKMEDAARFLSAFGAKQYYLAHLYEIGRDQMHMWDVSHARLLAERIQKFLPDAKMQVPTVGCGYRLFSSEEL